MPLFRYEIIDRNGKRMLGAMQAQSETEVRQVLISKGYTVSMVTLPGQSAAPAASSRQPVVSQPTAAPTSKSWTTASQKELALFFRQLAQQLHAGIGMHQALVQLSTQTRHDGMRKILESLAANVQTGGTLADGMAVFPRAFRPHVVGTVAAGEVGGLLPIMLADIALDYELALRASSRATKFISWSIWSTTFGFFLTAPALPLMMRGGFAAANQAGGTEFIGKMMQPFIAFTMHVTFPILAFLFGAYHIGALILKQPSMARTYHTLILKLPRFGKASRERSIASFTRILWRLQSAGVMPIKSWEVASRVPENSVIAESLQAQKNFIANGGRYSDALTQADVLTYDDIRQLSVAESTGQVTETLQRIAAYYEDAASVSAGKAKYLGLQIAIFFLILSMGATLIGTSSYFGEMIDGVDKFMGS